MHRETDGTIQKIPVLTQVKAFLTNKHWLIAFAMSSLSIAATNMRGLNNTTNYCQWILGANAQNNIQLYYMIASGIPMGIGILIIYPLAKKYGVKPVTLVSNAIFLAGVAICMMNPYNAIVAIIGGFIMNAGKLANLYLFSVLTMSVADSIEYRSGFRPEGCVGAAVIAAVQGTVLSSFSGMYETFLMRNGYDAFTTVGQNLATRNWIIFTFYGVDAIIYAVSLVLLIFFTIEKELPKIQAELKDRRQVAALARGEEWIESEEQDRREREENARLAEEARILDLRVRCAKKRLDFNAEEAKYQTKLAEKVAKANAKAARKTKQQGAAV